MELKGERLGPKILGKPLLFPLIISFRVVRLHFLYCLCCDTGQNVSVIVSLVLLSFISALLLLEAWLM